MEKQVLNLTMDLSDQYFSTVAGLVALKLLAYSHDPTLCLTLAKCKYGEVLDYLYRTMRDSKDIQEEISANPYAFEETLDGISKYYSDNEIILESIASNPATSCHTLVWLLQNTDFIYVRSKAMKSLLKKIPQISEENLAKIRPLIESLALSDNVLVKQEIAESYDVPELLDTLAHSESASYLYRIAKNHHTDPKTLDFIISLENCELNCTAMHNPNISVDTLKQFTKSDDLCLRNTALNILKSNAS